MTFDTYFRLTSYGLVGTAFAALSLTGELDFISIILYSIALIVSFRSDTRTHTRLRLREWMWRVLALAYVPFLFLDGMMTSRIDALVHMTLFLSAAKLFQEKRDRDWVFLYLIAFFQMLLAAGQTFDSTFIASLGFFIFFFVSTLAAFEIRMARREVNPLDEEIIPRVKKPRLLKLRRKQSAHAPDRPRSASPLAGRVRYLVGASFTQVLLVGILTFPFFFLIPRFGGGMTRGLSSADTLTGFSETVKLGEVATIKESQKVVMRVRLDHRPGKYIRWRGLALERYSGDAWNKTTGRRTEKLNSGRRTPGSEPLDGDAFERDYKLGEWSENRDPLEQKVVLEPNSTQTLFSAQRLVRLRGVLPEVSLDARSGAVTAGGIKGRIQYTAVSDLSAPDEQRLQLDSSASYPPEISPSCLQLPGEGAGEVRLDSRIKQLALEKTRGAKTPYEKARAIETYLKTQLAYTLELNFTKRDPLAEFLFDAKAGHCGYFATAMAIMMRMLDIPARIVNGFQMGDYNDVNGLYTVRGSDAHTWVEVYFADSAAWVEFDPTPAAGINDYSQGGLLARLSKYFEAAEVFWLDYVVTLDREEQASMMVELQHQLLSVKDRALDSYASVKRWFRSAANSLLDREWNLADILKVLGLVGVLVAASAGSYVALAYLKRRRRAPTGYGPWWHRLFILPRWSSARLAVRDPRTSAVLFYEQMLAITARAGLIKKPDQTPIEFAAGVGLPQIHEITAIYNRLRFGGARMEESDATRVSALLADLKRETRWEIRRKKGRDKQKDSSA